MSESSTSRTTSRLQPGTHSRFSETLNHAGFGNAHAHQKSSTQANGNNSNQQREVRLSSDSHIREVSQKGVHPSWLALIEFCRELGYGELERLSIQDGLPVVAETVRKKYKFTRGENGNA